MIHNKYSDIFILLPQLASIPGLEDVTVSTPAPSGAATAPAAGPAPPPASDVPQTAAEAQVIRTHFGTKYTCQ